MGRRVDTKGCERCGRIFQPCRFNRHSQKYCTDEVCVQARRREQQRQRYKKKYRGDALFREAECRRCGEGLRGRRKAGRTQAPQQADRQGKALAAAATPDATVAKPPPSFNMELFTTGFVSVMMNLPALPAVHETIRELERRGQQLAAMAALPQGSPASARGENVPLHPLEAARGVPLHPLRG